MFATATASLSCPFCVRFVQSGSFWPRLLAGGWQVLLVRPPRIITLDTPLALRKPMRLGEQDYTRERQLVPTAVPCRIPRVWCIFVIRHSIHPPP